MAMRPANSDDKQTDLATQRTRVRDEDQQALDADVAALITEWESAGQPVTGIPNRRYEVDEVAEAKRRVNRAFTLASKDRTPKLAPMWFKDGTKDSDGYVPIKFGVRLSATNTNTTEAAETEAAETETATGPVAEEAAESIPFEQDDSDQEGDQADESGGRSRRGRFARQ